MRGRRRRTPGFHRGARGHEFYGLRQRGRGLTPALSRRFRALQCRMQRAKPFTHCPRDRPPAAIAVVRISGPRAGDALKALIGRIPDPRKAALARIRGRDGEIIDQALALWFPGPHSETGEDVAELQLHGGRAVVAAVFGSACANRRLASGRGRRVHPPRLRERQARSDRGRRPCRPGDGGDAKGSAGRRSGRWMARCGDRVRKLATRS